MVDWRPFIFGGLASMTAECVPFPIDTTKTRLQVQGQRIDARLSELRYRGMVHCFVTVAREEGPRGLYSGLSPALLRQACYGTIKIGTYHNFKGYFAVNGEETVFTNVMAGILAGVVSSCIANPTDVLKIRMQARTDPIHKLSLPRAFADIARREGVRGLWRGVGPTANRAAIVVGVELPAYDMAKKFLLTKEFKDNFVTHFMASFFAGFIATIASNPVDVVKTRLMNQRNLKISPDATGSNAPAIYKGSIDCIRQTVSTEGFRALYKGFIPNYLRMGPWAIVYFLTYEKMIKTYQTYS